MDHLKSVPGKIWEKASQSRNRNRQAQAQAHDNENNDTVPDNREHLYLDLSNPDNPSSSPLSPPLHSPLSFLTAENIRLKTLLESVTQSQHVLQSKVDDLEQKLQLGKLLTYFNHKI